MPDRMLSLDRNENLYGPSPKCLEVLRNISASELSFYSRDYTRGVKSRLSECLAADLRIPESQVLLSEGSEDMLKQAVHCYLTPGGTILCPEQSWWYYRAVAEEVGGNTVTYRLKEEDHRYTYDVDEMIGLHRSTSPRVVLIASPNNPTGNSFPDEDLDRLAGAFRKSVLILDEAYWGFAENSGERVAELIKEYPNLLILRTFSKLYALAGARIAFAAAGTGLARLSKFASRYLGYNRISEQLALAALDSQEYYRAISGQMRADRKDFYRFFDGLDGFTCFRSDANFVLVRLPGHLKKGIDDHLRRAGMVVRLFSEPEFENCARITLGTPEQNRALLGAMEEFVKSRSFPTMIA